MIWRDDPRVVQCRTHLRGVRGRSWQRWEDFSRKDRASDSTRAPGTSRERRPTFAAPRRAARKKDTIWRGDFHVLKLVANGKKTAKAKPIDDT